METDAIDKDVKKIKYPKTKLHIINDVNNIIRIFRLFINEILNGKFSANTNKKYGITRTEPKENLAYINLSSKFVEISFITIHILQNVLQAINPMKAIADLLFSDFSKVINPNKIFNTVINIIVTEPIPMTIFYNKYFLFYFDY
jgi:hypothetical protein